MSCSNIAPAIMYVTIKLTGMLDTVALDQRACLFKYYPPSAHVCSTSPDKLTTDQASLLQGQQTYLPLCMFDYAALNIHTCLKPSSYICNSFMRLAGMLQYRCLKSCFEPTGMFVAVALDHLARPLQLNSTSMHVC